MKAETDFTRGSMFINILRLSIPLTLAQLVTLVYNIADRAFIGQMPDTGQLAIAGIGLTFPVATAVAAFSCLFGNGGVALFSIERGRQDHEKCRDILWNTQLALFVCSLAVTVLSYVFMKPLLFAFGASSDSWPYARDYLQIVMVGTPFLMLASGMNGFISAMSFAKTGMFITCSGAVINLVLDPILIYGARLGIQGAAIATVVSQLVSCGLTECWLYSKRSLYPMRKRNYSSSLLLRIATLGTAGFVMQITNCVNQIVCSHTLALWGSDLYISIFTVLNSVREMCQLPMNGISSGAQPVLGYNYGAGEYGRIRSGINIMTMLVVGWSLFAWTLVRILPTQVFRIFTSDPEMIDTGIKCLKIYFAGYFMMAFMVAGQSVFNGLGMARNAVFFSILRKVIILVPLAVFMPYKFGVMGVFIAEPVSNFIGGLASYLTMRFKMRKLLKQTAKP